MGHVPIPKTPPCAPPGGPFWGLFGGFLGAFGEAPPPRPSPPLSPYPTSISPIYPLVDFVYQSLLNVPTVGLCLPVEKRIYQ